MTKILFVPWWPTLLILWHTVSLGNYNEQISEYLNTQEIPQEIWLHIVEAENKASDAFEIMTTLSQMNKHLRALFCSKNMAKILLHSRMQASNISFLKQCVRKDRFQLIQALLDEATSMTLTLSWDKSPAFAKSLWRSIYKEMNDKVPLALHYAISTGKAQAVKILLDFKKKYQQESFDKASLLSIALRNDKPQSIAVIFNSKEDLNNPNIFTQAFACKTHDHMSDCLLFIIKKGFLISHYDWSSMIDKKAIDVIENIIAEHNLNAEALDKITVLMHPNSKHMVCLMAYAARFDNVEMVNFLHKKGCSIKTPSKENGSQPLAYAAQRGAIAAVRRLIALGANPLYKNDLGFDALYYTKESFKVTSSEAPQEIIKILEDAGDPPIE